MQRALEYVKSGAGPYSSMRSASALVHIRTLIGTTYIMIRARSTRRLEGILVKLRADIVTAKFADGGTRRHRG